jgi:hypothetical protein
MNYISGEKMLIKKMKIDPAKKYVAEKLRVGIADLVDEESMR